MTKTVEDYQRDVQRAREARELLDRLQPYVAEAERRIFEAWRTAKTTELREQGHHRLANIDFFQKLIQESVDGGAVAEDNLRRIAAAAAKKGS